MSTWRKLKTLTEMLTFAAGRQTKNEQRKRYDVEGELPKGSIPSHTRLDYIQQDFADGAALLLVSGVEYTGYCDTCAVEQGFTGYFAREKP